jgi:hypothetical protein
MSSSRNIRRDARLPAALAAGCLLALAGCSHAPPAERGGTATTRGDDDPWVSRGSMEAGPVLGNPKGPYLPRP